MGGLHLWRGLPWEGVEWLQWREGFMDEAVFDSTSIFWPVWSLLVLFYGYIGIQIYWHAIASRLSVKKPSPSDEHRKCRREMSSTSYREHKGGNGSCQGNSFTKLARKSSILTDPFYKTFRPIYDLFNPLTNLSL